jgi:hypothetical protein
VDRRERPDTPEVDRYWCSVVGELDRGPGIGQREDNLAAFVVEEDRVEMGDIGRREDNLTAFVVEEDRAEMGDIGRSADIPRGLVAKRHMVRKADVGQEEDRLLVLAQKGEKFAGRHQRNLVRSSYSK